MGIRVLVTRPQPGAARTATRLSEAGHQPIVLPLTEIVALDRGEKSVPVADCVVATSANALRHLPNAWRAGLQDMPLYAVGSETGAVARQLGFSCILEGGGNASDLATLVAQRQDGGSEILYLCGRVRMPDLEGELLGVGFAVRSVETYDTRAVVRGPGETIAVIGREPVGAVLLYSREAARAYMDVLSQPGVTPFLAEAVHVCISGRVASGLSGLDPSVIRIARKPTEDAMFSMLGGQ